MRVQHIWCRKVSQRMIMKLWVWTGHNSLFWRWEPQSKLLPRAEIPRHILVFAFTLHQQTGTIQTSAGLRARFSVEPVEIQPFNTPLSYVPFVSSDLVSAEISPAARILSFFFLFVLSSPLCRSYLCARLVIAAVRPERGCVNVRKASIGCASVAMDWFQRVFLPAPLQPSWDNCVNVRLPLSSLQLHVGSGQFSKYGAPDGSARLGTLNFSLLCALAGGGRGF